MKKTLALLALALLAPAASLAEPMDSGISGVVRGAKCGVPRDPGCRTTVPSPLTVRVARLADRSVVAMVHPKNGHFRVGLPAGTYTLSLLGGNTASRKPVQTLRIEVEAHRYTLVLLTFPVRQIR